jgi:hypothetical protein
MGRGGRGGSSSAPGVLLLTYGTADIAVQGGTARLRVPQAREPRARVPQPFLGGLRFAETPGIVKPAWPGLGFPFESDKPKPLA